VDEKLLAGLRQARERLIHAEQAAEAARAEFRGAVHRLVVHGSRSGDLAAALGLSHQQLDELVQGRFRSRGAGKHAGQRPGLLILRAVAA
jgi:hypothetical protein